MRRGGPGHRRAGAAAALLCGLTAVACPAAFSAQVAAGLAALNRVCRSVIDRRDFEEALRLCKRVSFDASKLAPGSQEHIASLINIGDIKSLVDNYVDADAYYASALLLAERKEGKDSAQAAELLTTLVETKVKRGKFLDAEALMRRLLAIRENAAGAQDTAVAIVRTRLADLLSQSREYPEAELAYGRAIGVLERGGAETADAYALAVQHLAEMYERRSQYHQAEMQYRRLLNIVERRTPAGGLLATTLDRLARVCEEQNAWPEATAFYQRELNTLSAANAPPQAMQTLQAKLAELRSAPPQPTP